MKNAVLAFINNRLDERISLDQLAKVTGYSPYHLHRKLKDELKEPIGDFIIRQRMQSAAYLLCLTKLRVNEIAALVGYESESAFCRAFKNKMGATPKAYAKQQHLHIPEISHSRYISLKCEVVQLPSREAVTFPSIGNYFRKDIYDVWEQVAVFLKDHELSENAFEYIGVLHDCQNVNPESSCRYDAALVSKSGIRPAVNKQFIKTLPGGKFARYRFSCPVSEYPEIGMLINAHLRDEAKLNHTEGISYFKFETLPRTQTCDQLFIEWFIPIIN